MPLEYNRFVKEVLDKTGINHVVISKAESGFTNNVYFIDDKYVIKLSNNEAIKEKLEKETIVYKNLKLPFISKYVNSGIYGDYRYLIITKVNGKSLYSIWHTLPKAEKTKVVTKIAEMLRTFHQADDTFLEKHNKTSIKEYVKDKLSKIAKKLQGLGFDVDYIQKIANERLDELFDNIATGLVYNDLHFDNVIYDGKELYLIDFDRTLVSALDYDMMIFKTMCENPRKFANEKDEVNVCNNDYKDVYQIFRDTYGELFSGKFVDSRITIYQFIYLINQALDNEDIGLIKHELEKFNLCLK